MSETTAEFGEVFQTPGDLKRIGRYELLGELARGGMGVVFRARDPMSRRVVALKLMRRSANPRMEGRFKREARALTRVRHPNVVEILDCNVSDEGNPFLVMELIDGESLQKRLDRDGPLDTAEALELSAALCHAVAACHEAGVLHRDLKPDNVLITRENEVKLTDFGLVRDVNPSESQTQLSVRGRGLGTPAYWAPEQGIGDLDAISTKTDVYGLGATLFALITGEPPHRGDTVLELMAAAREPKAPPSSLNPSVPKYLDLVVLQALAPDPSERYESALALLAALQPLGDSRSAERKLPPAWPLLLAVGFLLAYGATRWLAPAATRAQPDTRVTGLTTPVASPAKRPHADLDKPARLSWPQRIGDELTLLLTATLREPQRHGLALASWSLQISFTPVADPTVESSLRAQPRRLRTLVLSAGGMDEDRFDTLYENSAPQNLSRYAAAYSALVTSEFVFSFDQATGQALATDSAPLARRLTEATPAQRTVMDWAPLALAEVLDNWGALLKTLFALDLAERPTIGGCLLGEDGSLEVALWEEESALRLGGEPLQTILRLEPLISTEVDAKAYSRWRLTRHLTRMDPDERMPALEWPLAVELAKTERFTVLARAPWGFPAVYLWPGVPLAAHDEQLGWRRVCVEGALCWAKARDLTSWSGTMVRFTEDARAYKQAEPKGGFVVVPRGATLPVEERVDSAGGEGPWLRVQLGWRGHYWVHAAAVEWITRE